MRGGGEDLRSFVPEVHGNVEVLARLLGEWMLILPLCEPVLSLSPVPSAKYAWCRFDLLHPCCGNPERHPSGIDDEAKERYLLCCLALRFFQIDHKAKSLQEALCRLERLFCTSLSFPIMRRSSKYATRRIPLALNAASTGFRTFVKVRGAADSPNGRAVYS